MKRLSMAGANRGGWAFVGSYNVPLPPEVQVIDPKPHRAEKIASVWQSRGVKALGLQERAENIIPHLPEDFIGMLATDEVITMSNTIERANIPIQWQIIGKGIGSYSPVLGLSGTLPKGEFELRKSSAYLLKNLSPYSSSISSQYINTDPFTARNIAYTRNLLSLHSVNRISILDEGYEPEDISGSPLNLLFNGRQIPLVINKGRIETLRETKQRALETESPFIERDKTFATAIVLPNKVEIYVVEKRHRSRGIRFHTTFGQDYSRDFKKPTLFPTDNTQVASVPQRRKALVTD